MMQMCKFANVQMQITLNLLLNRKPQSREKATHKEFASRILRDIFSNLHIN